MTDTTVIQPKWIVAANERVRLQVTFAPELDAIVKHGEQFITTRRYQHMGTSQQGDFVEAVATLVAPSTDGLTISLCKKLWVNWKTPVEPPVVLAKTDRSPTPDPIGQREMNGGTKRLRSPTNINYQLVRAWGQQSFCQSQE
ncbi:MAG: hypothetical protein VKL59_07365 [Nostocaceae cyanobacterium]|nr:hypothetical protein [Nostocaceae cyanobacterium]